MALLSILFIICMIIGAVICNKIQQLYMKMIGVDYMRVGKGKIFAIFLVGYLIFSIICGIFGIKA